VFTAEGLRDFIEPRAFGPSGLRIATIVREYAWAARLAVEQAGFEGV